MASNPAAVAYEAYRTSMNARADKNSTYLMTWSYVPEHEKEAWLKAAEALAKQFRPEPTKEGEEDVY